MNWRWYLFWIKDFITGGKIYKAYKDIKKSYYCGNKDLDEDIEKLLKHATNTSTFYSQYKGKSIKEFPVINKTIIRENFEQMQSELYKGKILHKMSTSGSTGTPLTVVQNKTKRDRVIAAVIFFRKAMWLYIW